MDSTPTSSRPGRPAGGGSPAPVSGGWRRRVRYGPPMAAVAASPTRPWPHGRPADEASLHLARSSGVLLGTAAGRARAAHGIETGGTRARPRGRRRPSRPRGRGRRAIPAGPPDGRQFQDRSAKGTPRDGQRGPLRDCLGYNRPRPCAYSPLVLPLRTSRGMRQLHKLSRRPNSKVTASG